MIHIFTHTDLDGSVSGLFLSHYIASRHESEVLVHYCSAGTYGNLSTEINNVLDSSNDVESIYVTDITPDENTVKRLAGLEIPVQIIDHHETSAFLVEQYPNMIINKSSLNGQHTAAATLVYDYLVELNKREIHKGDILPEKLAQITRSYDTWDWALDENDAYGVEARKFDGLLYIYGKEIFINHTLKALTESNQLMSDEDAIISDLQLKRDTTYITTQVKSAKYATFTLPDGAKVRAAVIIGDKLFSEIGNEALKTIDPETNEKTHLAILFNNGKLSFRSDDVIDSSAVAKIFGGGGHPKASGAYIEFDAITFIQRELTKLKK